MSRVGLKVDGPGRKVSTLVVTLSTAGVGKKTVEQDGDGDEKTTPPTLRVDKGRAEPEPEEPKN